MRSGATTSGARRKVVVPLTKEEKEIKEWAGESFRAPWFELVDKCRMLKQGEKLEGDDVYLHPYFVDVLLDTRILCRAMGVLKVSRFVGGNLFTIILSKREDRVIWACVEKEEGGVFVDKVVLDPSGDWADKVAEMLFTEDMQGAYNFLSEWVRKNEIADSIGAIKVANIMFFKTIKDAWESSQEGKNLPLFALKFLDAVKTNIEKKWIRFYPDVPLAKMIRFSYPLLKRITKMTNPLSYVVATKPLNDLFVSYYSFIFPIKVPLPELSR